MVDTQDRMKRKAWVEAIMTIALALIIAALLLQVFARYVAKVSIPWTEEISRYLLVLLTFTGAAVAVRDRQHIAITFLLDRLPEVPRLCTSLVFDVLAMLFMGAVFRGSLNMIRLTWETPAGTIPWISTGKIYLILPFSCLLMMAYLLAQVFHAAKRLSSRPAGEGVR
jgi:TRAP-type transport system small permease protein